MKDDSITGFGDRLKQVRQHFQLKPKNFGEKLRITKNWVSKLEKGTKSPPSAQLTLLISLVFNVNETWLLTGKGEMLMEIRSNAVMMKKQIMTELQGTDIAMARIVEEIIEKLLEKNIIQEKELSIYAQEMFSRRKILRERYGRNLDGGDQCQQGRKDKCHKT